MEALILYILIMYIAALGMLVNGCTIKEDKSLFRLIVWLAPISIPFLLGHKLGEHLFDNI